MQDCDVTEHRGWIYICVDPKDTSICKIGMTRRELYVRVTETTNPHYIIFAAYKVPEDEALEIEKYVHRDLGRYNVQREDHSLSRRKSEWFSISAVEAIKLLDWSLSHCLDDVSWDGDINRPSNYENIRYIPSYLQPGDQTVLNELHEEYLDKIKRRRNLNVDGSLYGD